MRSRCSRLRSRFWRSAQCFGSFAIRTAASASRVSSETGAVTSDLRVTYENLSWMTRQKAAHGTADAMLNQISGPSPLLCDLKCPHYRDAAPHHCEEGM